jgi:hypothetical protein
VFVLWGTLRMKWWEYGIVAVFILGAIAVAFFRDNVALVIVLVCCAIYCYIRFAYFADVPERRIMKPK